MRKKRNAAGLLKTRQCWEKRCGRKTTTTTVAACVNANRSPIRRVFHGASRFMPATWLPVTLAEEASRCQVEGYARFASNRPVRSIRPSVGRFTVPIDFISRELATKRPVGGFFWDFLAVRAQMYQSVPQTNKIEGPRDIATHFYRCAFVSSIRSK